MNPDFIPLSYPHNWNQPKNSNIGSHLKYSHPLENMCSTNYLKIQITKCLKQKMRLIFTIKLCSTSGDSILRLSLWPGLVHYRTLAPKELPLGKKVAWKVSPTSWSWIIIKIIPDFVLNSRTQLIITRFLRPKRKWKRNTKIITITLWSAMIMIL